LRAWTKGLMIRKQCSYDSIVRGERFFKYLHSRM
jgi:hypothetical protein